MAILEILTYPHPFLRTKAAPVDNVDEEVLAIIDDMAQTMFEAPGAGLAAIQVGIDKQIIVVNTSTEDEPKTYRALINPKIVEQSGSIISESEGCLSVLGFLSDVKRSSFVRVEALDQNGDALVIEDNKFLAVILQHEIDHLNGILFIDRISALKRKLYIRRIKKSRLRA